MTDTIPLSVEDVVVNLASGAGIVKGVSFQVASGEVLGLVGESGSGKTTVSLTALGYARPGARIAAGRVRVQGQDLLSMSESARVASRGSLIAYVPQDPSIALNPSLRVEVLVSEMLRAHWHRDGWEDRIGDVLAKVGLPNDKRFRRRFPHQLSGGQQQRLAIAMALVCEPAVLVMDEPTTGLDVITQALVLDEVKRLCRESGVAIVYVTHDLAVVADIADRIAVMYAGRVVEQGPADIVLRTPRHPYTVGLIESIPDHRRPRTLRGIPGVAVGVGDELMGCAFAPRCRQTTDACHAALPQLEPAGADHAVRCIHWRQTPAVIPGALRSVEADHPHRALLEVRELTAEHRTRTGTVVAADAVSFSIDAQECVALVGESGSGKTTIARCVAGLHARTAGAVIFDGAPLPPLARERSRDLRRRVQIVFQNPYDSLNPNQTVAHTLGRPLALFRVVEGGAIPARILELLEQVQLPSTLAERYPTELSGGERQRVAIARALAATPDLLICDEVTSALDVSVQAVVLELLAGLRRQLGLAMLFISHDLGVVSTIADRVLVLEEGHMREQGRVGSVLAAPSHSYTRALIEAAPSLPAPPPSAAAVDDPRQVLSGSASSGGTVPAHPIDRPKEGAS